MPRFYCAELSPPPPPPENAGVTTVLIDEDQTRHARRVLRLSPGDTVQLFNGQGVSGEGRITAWLDAGRGSRAQVQIESRRRLPPPQPQLDIAAAVPKGHRPEEMLEQLSQLGADRMIPLRTARSVVDPRPAKLERLARAAIESARQCGRDYLLQVLPTMTLEQVLRESHDLRLLADPRAALSAEQMGQRLRSAQRVLVLVGPEGGWTEQELAAATAAGCIPWRLGPHVLRIETAAVAAAGIARYLTQMVP